MLITKSDIAARHKISTSVQNSTAHDREIGEFIEQAELEELRPLMGAKFYQIVANDEVSWAEILDTHSYEYDDVTYSHKGIKAVLSDFAYARYVLYGGDQATPFGFVDKDNQDSNRLSSERLKAKSKVYQQSAITLWSDIRLFMERHPTDYPDFCRAKSRGPGFFRLSKVTTSDDRSRQTGHSRDSCWIK